MIVGILSFFIIFRFAPTRYIAMAIVPASVNSRSNLSRNGEFECLLAFLIVTPANQSTVWLIEEKYLPEHMLSFFEYSKQKASPAEMADEPIKASIKYAKGTRLDRFSPIILSLFLIIKEPYHRTNIYTSK